MTRVVQQAHRRSTLVMVEVEKVAMVAFEEVVQLIYALFSFIIYFLSPTLRRKGSSWCIEWRMWTC